MSTAVLAITKALRDALPGLEPALYSGADAAELTVDFSLTVKMLEASLVRLAARATECGEHAKAGSSRPSDWLARQTGRSAGSARRDLELAAKLDDHPQSKAALEKGEVSLEAADEAVRTEEACPGSEGEILDEARRTGLKAAKEKGRRLRQRAQDVEELERKRLEARSVRTWTDDLGMLNVLAKLLPEDGQRFLSRLEAETERQWRWGNRESSIEQRTHDAFVKILEGKGRGPARRPEAVVVINPDEGTAHLPAHGPITMRSARDMARDAIVTLVLHDGKTITDYRRFNRTIPVELEILLELGPPPEFDGMVCVDCGGRFYPQIDHVDPCANGGATTFFNLNPRCPKCHQAKTEADRQAGLLGPEAGTRAKARRTKKARPPSRAPRSRTSVDARPPHPRLC